MANAVKKQFIVYEVISDYEQKQHGKSKKEKARRRENETLLQKVPEAEIRRCVFDVSDFCEHVGGWQTGLICKLPLAKQ